MANAVKSSCINLGCIYPSLELDAEERIKRLVIRLAIGEKLASRIGAMSVAWSGLVVLGAFGYLIKPTDLLVISVITLAEAFRLSVRDLELQMQTLSRELEVRSGWTKVDFSILPMVFVDNAFKPEFLRNILWLAEVVSAVSSIILSIWRLGHHDFCTSSVPIWTRQSCQNSAYILHGMTVVGSAVFLVGKGYFLRLLISVRTRRLDHSLIFEKFSIAVYIMCLKTKGSIYDGLEMNLVVFGTQWLQSSEFEKQLRGAKLLNKLMAAWRTAEHKLSSETADAVRRLGAYPGLMDRLVEMLSWNQDDEDLDELSDEVASIICHLVASDHNCSTFAAVPGALDAIMTLIMRRAEKPIVGESSALARNHEAESNGISSENCRDKCLQVLQSLASNKSTSARAMHQPMENCRDKCLHVLRSLASNESTSARAMHQPIADFQCMIMGDSRLHSAADVIDLRH